jgi:hypothetical protein
MDKFNTSYLSSESQASAYDLDAVESDLQSSFESFELGDEPADVSPDPSEAPIPDGADWLNAIGSEQLDVASIDEEPMAADEFSFSEASEITGDDFTFEMTDDEAAAEEFGFSEEELEAFGLPEAELGGELSAVDDFDVTGEGAAAEEFGFSEEELEAFGLPEAELGGELSAVDDFDVTGEGVAAEEGFGFDEEALFEQPAASREFDFISESADVVSDDLDAVPYRSEEADFRLQRAGAGCFHCGGSIRGCIGARRRLRSEFRHGGLRGGVRRRRRSIRLVWR